ncbi:hypothetical protein [Stenotrophomonas maltophilia group sp. RNC7]|uniref:hypothetical protein n=1 Tax=Stenotrophomonas maltophilia group sp. RNC7 TaxID=3071467 RepID=UPI0027E1C193|nr:hypothetical protein [Stenotrophomonas maltophilia group sp. RNC7]MDQ4678161.1 hypothetical protein [Stenotrophomonas maltophilia group sp. RNC7]
MNNNKRRAHDISKTSPHKPLIVIFEELDLTWTEEEMETAIKLYNIGFNIIDMARLLRPVLDSTDGQCEVILLIQYLIYIGKIDKRRGES